MSDSHSKAMATVERAAIAQSQHVHPLVQLATRGDGAVDPALLRDLMQLQREHEANEARKVYAAAMVRLKRDLPRVIEHDAVVDFTNKSNQRTYYTHTTLAQIIEEVTPHLTAHGFALTSHSRTPDRNTVEVTSVLAHEGGHSETITMTAPVDTSGNKNGIQAIASATSYLRRYQATELLGIATRGIKEPTGEPDTRTPFDLSLAALRWCATVADLDAWVAKAKTSTRLTEDDHARLRPEYVAVRARIEQPQSPEDWSNVGPPPMTDADFE